ncbi:ABC transporter permease [Halosimplex pelagicum]|uniref:ABC transporter permease n=1 Tax=Halosimplex pelagicum TaxID=869886 RepID=A0A7D5PBW6_9EURY|nr:ABC transporter permease [Halosimplex pelagicum]QLH81998.1 ABC transporter permease [Halosimplex pelagicum]
MRYVLKRFGQAVLTLFVVVTVAFILYRLMPGNPVSAYKAQLLEQAEQTGTQVDIEEINRRAELYLNVNPDQPIHLAYLEYMREALLNQDFGESLWYNRPVFDILFQAMPWSIFISIYSLILGRGVSLSLGMLMAYKEGSKFDYGMTIFGQALSAIPYYVGAIVLLAFLGYQTGIFPTGGRYDTATTPGFNIPFMLGVLHHGALPILSGFILGFGGNLSMRANAISVMGADYLRFARLRGVGTGRLATLYVGRNAILPLYTGIMIGISGIFSSSIILEQIFSYPGVGWFTFGALQSHDYPLLMGAFIFYTTITVTGILIADLTYGLVDPRVRSGGERESF